MGYAQSQSDPTTGEGAADIAEGFAGHVQSPIEYAQMLRTLLGNLEGMLYRCRLGDRGQMQFVSEGAIGLTGYAPSELIGENHVNFHDLIHPADRTRIRTVPSAEAALIGADERYSIEYRIRRADGEERWVWDRGVPVRDADGNVRYFEGFIKDVTERKSAEARIDQQANYDALTGLANRFLLNSRLQQAIEHAERAGTRLAVAFLDLDQFKIINDTFGHHLGDALLRTMAERLKSCVRAADTVARHGGDEFVLVLTEPGDPGALAPLLQRVLSTAAEAWQVGKREFHVSCSIGVAFYPQDGRTAEVLLRNADAAMYRAKENGRNTFQFFTTELSRLMAERVSIEQKLRVALKRRQFVLHYQPRIDLHSGRIVGAEALIRWRQPRRGLVAPGRFIPIAEDCGLIVPIGSWVLQTACQQNKAWQIEGLPPIVVSVNVSPSQFRQDALVSTLERALEQSGLDPQYLQLELTENLVMNNAEHFVEKLGQIKRLGVQIAVDDFGTGYSSLSYLKRFPVDYLKVDRSFVQDLAADPDDAAIVQAIIALGHKLGLKIVAEGVETQDQLTFLGAHGCDEVQGFHFGKPVVAAEFSRLLSSRSDSALLLSFE